MAYKAENETRVTLADINKNKRGDVIRVSSVESSSGEKSYDIRNMYVTESGELGFTSKGIRIKEDLIHDVIVSIMKDLDTDTYNKIIDSISNDEE